jgi:hypothetical protein
MIFIIYYYLLFGPGYVLKLRPRPPGDGEQHPWSTVELLRSPTRMPSVAIMALTPIIGGGLCPAVDVFRLNDE